MWVNVQTGDAGHIDEIVIVDIPKGSQDDLIDFVNKLNTTDRWTFCYLVGKVINAN